MTRLAFAALAVGLAFGASAAQEKKDEKKPRKAQATAEGRVKSVDAKARSLRLFEPYNPNYMEVTITFTPEATVFVDGKVAKFEDVPTGKDVHARVTGGTVENSRITDATELVVIGRQTRGHLRKIGKDSITYTPEGAAKNKLPDETAKLSPDLTVFIGGKEAKLSDLKPGEYVGLRYSADGKFLRTIARTAVPKKN